MEKFDNQLLFKAVGTVIQIVTRSSPATIVLLFYALFGIFSLLFEQAIFWMSASTAIGVVLIILWIFKPDRLYTERHTLEMKRLDISELGDKKNPQVDIKEYDQLYRPVRKRTKTSK